MAERRGDGLFKDGQKALASTPPDVGRAKQCLRDAAVAFGQAGATKKQQMMNAMLKRLTDTVEKTAGAATESTEMPDTEPAPAPAPAPALAPEVKKKYSMDYSRFNALDCDSDEEDDAPADQKNRGGVPPPRGTLKFLEAVKYSEEVQKRGSKPQELARAEQMFADAFEEATPDERRRIWDFFNANGANLPAEPKEDFLGGSMGALKSALQPLSPAQGKEQDADPAAISAKLEAMKKGMHEDLAALNARMDSMKQQEEALSNAKDMDDLLGFMQRSGMTEQQIQTAMEAHEEGNEEAVQRILTDVIRNNLASETKDFEEDISAKMDEVQLVSESVHGKKVNKGGSEKKAGSGFSFYRKADDGKEKKKAGNGDAQILDLEREKAALEEKMGRAMGDLKTLTKSSEEHAKTVEAAKQELADAEKAKADASEQVDQAAAVLSNKWEQEEEDGKDSSGERRHLAEKEKEMGNKLFVSGDYGQAIEHFTRALRFAGPSAVYYTNRAAAHLRKGDAADALRDAEEALKVDARHVKALFRRAQALEALGRYDDAVAAYREGLGVMPESEQLQQGLDAAEKAASVNRAGTRSDLLQAAAAAPPPAQAAGGGGTHALKYTMEETAENVMVVIELPGRENMQGVDLQTFPESLSLRAPPFAPLSVSLPSQVHCLYLHVRVSFRPRAWHAYVCICSVRTCECHCPLRFTARAFSCTRSRVFCSPGGEESAAPSPFLLEVTPCMCRNRLTISSPRPSL